MPIASINGVQIYYEEAGTGFPVIFCHELASDCRAWDHHFRVLSQRYRCIRYNSRGYPPSEVPAELEAYSHDALVADMRCLLLRLNVSSAHLIGVATGGGVALNLAIQSPELVRSLVVVGAGAGAVDREAWLAGAKRLADEVRERGIGVLAASMETAPQRVALRKRDPIAWTRFITELNELSAVGCAHMLENAMMRRKTLRELESQIVHLPTPVLVAVGDQDAPAFDPCVFLSRSAPFGALAVFPFTGHMVPLEQPALLEAIVSDFLAAVDRGSWGDWTDASVRKLS